ncbi:hypothetical protein [Wenyingzhuangia marina]|uniref:YceI-like domain-containing protein n=1 Tax=Wenyingzhuangia marina TaxID=1195760 RepID=A0A1M5VXH9_9FLAO|nr:hypothetical protein [Wenyingzhuangia marina]GGF77382.1 hypothetical protein GCM10011397_20510 [Wenyingzhuangia marina]SHH79633.1 hypothetical protein SAMN05444281_2014 [Wenyingzhuangia marina]
MVILNSFLKGTTILIFIISFYSSNLLSAQVINKDSTYSFNSKNINFVKLKQPQKKKTPNDLEAIKRSITSSPFIKGYHYSFNLNQLEKFIPIQDIDNFLRLPQKSFFKSSLFKNTNTDIRFKSYVNMNGAAQIITLKGGFFNNYNGNYTLQISYHISPNNYNIKIPNLIKQEVQNGLALKLKINLENGSK